MTSIQCFKYMALYSLTEFFSVALLYLIDSNLADLQYLWIDMFHILPLAILSMCFCVSMRPSGVASPREHAADSVTVVTRTEPNDQVDAKRPYSSLFSIPIFASIVGQVRHPRCVRVPALLNGISDAGTAWVGFLDCDPNLLPDRDSRVS